MSFSSLQSAGFTLGAVGSQKMKRWEADYVLEELDKLHLFDEYIEMSESIKKRIIPVFPELVFSVYLHKMQFYKTDNLSNINLSNKRAAG